MAATPAEKVQAALVIAEFYRSLLRREPDAGAADWTAKLVGRIDGGLSFEAAKAATFYEFVAQPEYKALQQGTGGGGTMATRAQLEALHQSVFNRTLSEAGVAQWLPAYQANPAAVEASFRKIAKDSPASVAPPAVAVDPGPAGTGGGTTTGGGAAAGGIGGLLNQKITLPIVNVEVPLILPLGVVAAWMLGVFDSGGRR